MIFVKQHFLERNPVYRRQYIHFVKYGTKYDQEKGVNFEHMALKWQDPEHLNEEKYICSVEKEMFKVKKIRVIVNLMVKER